MVYLTLPYVFVRSGDNKWKEIRLKLIHIYYYYYYYCWYKPKVVNRSSWVRAHCVPTQQVTRISYKF